MSFYTSVSLRVFHGGSWLYFPQNAEIAYRFANYSMNIRDFNVGLRLVRRYT